MTSFYKYNFNICSDFLQCSLASELVSGFHYIKLCKESTQIDVKQSVCACAHVRIRQKFKIHIFRLFCSHIKLS